MSLLKHIDSPQDLKRLSVDQLPALCAEIRDFFIEHLLKNGGHFSGNLGVVELTVALHYVFDFKADRLVWDVGHQSYIHKLLTGRKKDFDGIRSYKGLSGFPKRDESPYDHFGTGHSSTSVSAVLGMAEAARQLNKDRQHIAVIGDGSLSGGMALEALNNLGVSQSNVLVILNDNQMGIDPSEGAISQHLAEIDYISPNLFENFQLPYEGPLDGHDVEALVHEFETQLLYNHPRILHLKTVKGKGYEPAEREQTEWHSVKYVKLDSVKPSTLETKPDRFQDVFGKTLLDLARQDERVVGITPAMPSGSSMIMLLQEMPERVYDVGIAEQHAVTFAAGLAAEGMRPFCHLYSSFAQRAFDQIIHDVALQNLPVIFCIDRAGLVGEDGPTHHGVFDISFLRGIPNLSIVSPMDELELRTAMHWAIAQAGPVVIRYPRGRGSLVGYEQKAVKTASFEGSRVLTEGQHLAVISIGAMGAEIQAVLANTTVEGSVQHLDLRFVKPLDVAAVNKLFEHFKRIVIIEEGVKAGGIAEEIQALAQDRGYRGELHIRAISDEFTPHGSITALRERYGLDRKSLRKLFEDLQ